MTEGLKVISECMSESESLEEAVEKLKGNKTGIDRRHTNRSGMSHKCECGELFSARYNVKCPDCGKHVRRCTMCDEMCIDGEWHHLFPQQYWTIDDEWNMKYLCKDCHHSMHRVYDDEFWNGIVEELNR